MDNDGPYERTSVSVTSSQSSVFVSFIPPNQPPKASKTGFKLFVIKKNPSKNGRYYKLYSIVVKVHLNKHHVFNNSKLKAYYMEISDDTFA